MRTVFCVCEGEKRETARKEYNTIENASYKNKRGVW